MKNKIYVLLVFVALIANACKSTLDEFPYNKFNAQYVFTDPLKAEQYVMRNYNVLPYGSSDANGYNRLGGGASMIACASDEAMPNLPGGTVENLTNGSWSPSSSNPDNPWDGDYQYIRSINIGLENLNLVPASAVALRNQWYGELIYLRAYAHFDLIKRYGGIPIITKSLGFDELSIPRSTYAECVNFVTSQCDTAVKYLPSPDIASGAQLGRISTGIALALKSRMLLYAASDLYNGPGYDGTTNPLIGYGSYLKTRWEDAAQASAAVIALGFYHIYTPAAVTDAQTDAVNNTNAIKNYSDLFYTLTGNTELILIRTSPIGNAVEKKNTPVGITSGAGTTNPSQQMIDAYGMYNGKSISDASYNALAPYTNRDPRFNASIFYNGKVWGRAIETFTDGLDNKLTATNATKTGYYLSKFMKSGIVISGSQTNTNHCFPLIRYAEILLNYAEAMNEAYGPDVDPKGFGKTARQAVVEVRLRVLPPKYAVLSTVAAGDVAAMRAAIRNERCVELAFEDQRQIDVRRWKIAPATIGTSLNGMTITRGGTSPNYTYTYTVKPSVALRVFDPKMYLYPIPQGEINKNKALIQNPLWSTL